MDNLRAAIGVQKTTDFDLSGQIPPGPEGFLGLDMHHTLVVDPHRGKKVIGKKDECIQWIMAGISPCT